MGPLQLQMGFPVSPWGLLSSFLTLHLLRLGSAQFRVVGPGRPLLATVGKDVVLPCHLSPGVDARSLEVRWIRHQVSGTVHLYRNGEDQYGEQMEQYAGRTELARDFLHNGSLDLRISGLRPSDDGQYVCTVQDAASYGEAVVELQVAALGSVPLLSLEASEFGGFQVVCRSAGWYPPPQVLWKDGSGQHLPSVSQRRSPDEQGLFEIQDVIAVSGKADMKVWCVVRNSLLQQEQESSLHISAPIFYKDDFWIGALVTFLLLLLILFGIIAYLFQRKVVQSRALAWRMFLLLQNQDVVTLDPNTAHSELVLSEDLRSVRCGRTRQNLPDTPETFKDLRFVLGQQRFREGRHCWEVIHGGVLGWSENPWKGRRQCC